MRQTENFMHTLDIAAALFDHTNIANLGRHLHDKLWRHIHATGAGVVVNHNRQRRNLAASLLFEALADKVSFDLPAGGMALWLRCSKVLSEEAIAKLRLLGFSGEYFFAQGEDKGVHIRFGFASLNEQEIAESVQQLQKCLLDQGI